MLELTHLDLERTLILYPVTNRFRAIAICLVVTSAGCSITLHVNRFPVSETRHFLQDQKKTG